MLVPLLLVAAPCLAQAARAPEELAAEILRGARYQTELPRELPTERPAPAPGLRVGRLPGWIGWALLGALGVAGALWLARARQRSERDVEWRPAPERARARPAARLAAEPLEDAEALAREGRFGDAIRALLRQTFAVLRLVEGARLEPWLTSREVARLAELPPAGAARLGELVQAVELSLFAGRVPGRAEYERCAQAFQALHGAARGSQA